jgi:hypothetical protein
MCLVLLPLRNQSARSHPCLASSCLAISSSSPGMISILSAKHTLPFCPVVASAYRQTPKSADGTPSSRYSMTPSNRNIVCHSSWLLLSFLKIPSRVARTRSNWFRSTGKNSGSISPTKWGRRVRNLLVAGFASMRKKGQPGNN